MAVDDSEPNGHPTETSPLLSRKDGPDVEPTAGVVPDGDASTEGAGQVIDDSQDGPDLERETASDDRQKQFEGMPEVMKQMKYIIPAVGIGIFLAAADQTIIVSSYGKIGSELNALNQTSWIATAYFLTLTTFQPLYGKLSDIFGRKACLLFAYTIFGLGCIFCGLAQNIEQLIAARAFAGIGGGGMTTVVSILMSDIIPLRNRGTWQGYINIIYSAGAASGAPLGGILADTIGWRWAFLLQGPMCAIAFIACSFLLRLPKRGDEHWKEKLRRIDFLGAAILIGAVFSLLLAFDRGSNIRWKATITIVSISISIPLFLLFVLVEMKVAKEPFAPGHIIFNRAMIANYLCLFFSMAGFIAALFYVPLYFQAVDSLSATGAAVRLIPGIVCSVLGSLFGGFYMKWSGKYYWLTVLTYAGALVGTMLIFLCSGAAVHSTVGIIVGLSASAFANGIGSTSTLIALISNASREDQAIATACSYLFRSLGSVFGISMSATVANLELRKALASELPALGLPQDKALEIADRVRESLAYLRKLGPEVRAVVVDCYTKSTNAAFALQMGLAVCAAIAAWFVREKALKK